MAREQETYLQSPASSTRDELQPGSPRFSNLDEKMQERVALVAAGDRTLLPSMSRTQSSLDESIMALCPEEAMSELLKHVRLDPDGGIMNISNNILLTKQQSKLFALKKDGTEIFVILIVVSRALINTAHIITSNVYFLDLFFVHGYQLSHLYSKIALTSLHVVDLFLAIHVLELLIFAYLALRFLYDTCKVVCLSHSTVDSGEHVVNPRYFHIQRLVWDDFRRVQGFSVLQAFRILHPTLLNRYLQSLSVQDIAARYILEKFLRIESDALTDHEIVEHAAAEIIRSGAHAAIESIPSRQLRDDDQLAAELVRCTPREIVTKVFNLGQTEGHEQFSSVDWTVLQYGWRFGLLRCLEKIAFIALVVLACVIGFVGFLAKLCHSTILLTDPDANIVTVVVYVIGFTNQVMGVMAVNQLLIWRVQETMFGGSDSKFSAEETFIMNTYFALLAEKVCTNNGLSTSQKLAVLLGLDDQDLQQMVIEEDIDVKARILLGVKAYMKQHGLGSTSALARWAGGK